MSFIKEEFHFDKSIPFSLFETNASQVMIHCHDCLEINYITQGSGHYIIEDKSYPISEGDVFLINNAEHHMAVHDGTLTMMVFIFTPNFVWENPAEYNYLEPFFSQNASFSNRISTNHSYYHECSALFRQIIAEYHQQTAGWQLIIKALLLLFLGYLNRQCLLNDTTEISSSHRINSYDKLRPVIEYIHDHFQERITLEQLAKEAHMNKSYLSAYFSNAMKLHIVEYIEQVRISNAKLLLKTTSLPITEIAYASGFNNLSYFNRIFKRITRTTPLKYRANSKNNTISEE